jgi:hypothetical protein
MAEERTGLIVDCPTCGCATWAPHLDAAACIAALHETLALCEQEAAARCARLTAVAAAARALVTAPQACASGYCHYCFGNLLLDDGHQHAEGCQWWRLWCALAALDGRDPQVWPLKEGER